MDYQDDPRCAGKIIRWHTVPHVRQQSVGEHTWQVMRILLAVWPECPRELLVHALIHDAGELKLGDLPYPVKRSLDESARKQLKNVEEGAILGMCMPWGLPPPRKLENFQKTIFKFAEMVEMLEWTFDEIELGNKSVEIVKQRCQLAIDSLSQQLLKEFNTELTAHSIDLNKYLAKRIRVHEERVK